MNNINNSWYIMCRLPCIYFIIQTRCILNRPSKCWINNHNKIIVGELRHNQQKPIYVLVFNNPNKVWTVAFILIKSNVTQKDLKMERVYLECTIWTLERKMSIEQIYQPHDSQYVEKIPCIYHKKKSSHVALPLQETLEDKGKGIPR